jgi:hypothetical protein
MDSPVSSNGNRPTPSERKTVNPYADAALGTEPREIAEFQLNTDPYANVVPSAGRRVAVDLEDGDWGGRTRPGPFVIGLSVFLVLLLILPPLAVVLSRLGI